MAIATLNEFQLIPLIYNIRIVGREMNYGKVILAIIVIVAVGLS
jgi:hypothetical protein